MHEAEDELTPSERAFVEQYLIDHNATAAYRRARPGASYATAAVAGCRFLKNPKIRAELRAARSAQQGRTRIGADAVLRALANIAHSDPIEFVDGDGNPLPLHQIHRDARRTIATVEIVRETTTTTRRGKTITTVTSRVVRYRMWDKIAALRRLAAHLGINQPITPLDALLNLLPADLSAQVRAALEQQSMRSADSTTRP